jgi:hypothetical protein
MSLPWMCMPHREIYNVYYKLLLILYKWLHELLAKSLSYFVNLFYSLGYFKVKQLSFHTTQIQAIHNQVMDPPERG